MNKYPPDRTRDSGSLSWLGPAQLRVFRVVALFGLVALAGTALLLAIVWGKEGFGREDLPRCAVGLLALAVSGIAWWLLCRKLAPLASGALLGVGTGVILLPSLVYTAFGLRTIVNSVRGDWLSRHAALSGYREAAIVWSGFDGPVGLAVDFDLSIPARLEGNLLPPRLAYSGPAGFTSADYFSTRFYRLAGHQLTQPVFPAVDPVIERSRLASGRPIHLSYRLYPGYVRRLEPGNRVCIDTAAVLRAERAMPPAANQMLGASWFFAGAGALNVDLSRSLTATLHDRSRWAARPPAWDSLLRRFTPPSLGAAGYVVCGKDVEILSAEQCWCAPHQ